MCPKNSWTSISVSYLPQTSYYDTKNLKLVCPCHIYPKLMHTCRIYPKNLMCTTIWGTCRTSIPMWSKYNKNVPVWYLLEYKNYFEVNVTRLYQFTFFYGTSHVLNCCHRDHVSPFIAVGFSSMLGCSRSRDDPHHHYFLRLTIHPLWPLTPQSSVLFDTSTTNRLPLSHTG